MLLPRQKTPDLAVDTAAHGRFDLGAENAERGVVLCFYRGLHCPVCARYLADLAAHLEAFAERGFSAIAISADPQDRARAMAEKIGSPALRIGCGLALSKAREWGLYLSTSRGTTSIGIEEPAIFSEPGLFVVKPDQTLYCGAVQTMPFARPPFRELVGALDFVIQHDYPARGEYTGPV